MKPFELSTGSYLGVEVPEGTSNIRLSSVHHIIQWKEKGMEKKPYWNTKKLPPGQYSLIGENPLQLTEKECAEIVERAIIVEHGVKETWYKDYCYPSGAHHTATLSYQSLLTSLGLKEPVVILRKNG